MEAMKKGMKKAIAFLLAFALVFAYAPSAKAEGGVTVSEDNSTITITGNVENVSLEKEYAKTDTAYESIGNWTNYSSKSINDNKWRFTIKNSSDKDATVSLKVKAKDKSEGVITDYLVTTKDEKNDTGTSGMYDDTYTFNPNFESGSDETMIEVTKDDLVIPAGSSKDIVVYFIAKPSYATKTFAFDANLSISAVLDASSDSTDPVGPDASTLDPSTAQHYELGVTDDHLKRYSIKGDKCIVAVRDAAGAYRGGETFYVYDGMSNTLVSSFVMEEDSAHTHTVLCVPGQAYKFAISDKKFTTTEDIKAFCAAGTTDVVTIPSKAELAEPYLQWEPQTPTYTINTATITVKRPLGTMVDVYRDGKLITTIKGEPNKDGKSSFVDKGLTAATTYKYKLVPCFVDNGVKWECTPKEYTVKTATAAKPFLNVTKFDANTVNLTIAPDRSHVANGEAIYKLYEGKKLLKTYKDAGKKVIIYKYKKKGAAKKKFKVVTICNTNTKLTAACPLRKSQKNTYKRTWGKPKVSNMKNYSEAYYPTKVTSDGKKVTVTGYLLNSHVVSIKETGYINVYYDCVDGTQKYLGRKKVKATIPNRSMKKVTFTIKLKKQMDVKNGSAFLIDSSKIEWKY